MIRSALIGLDGSAYSESAIRLGIEWAKTQEMQLIGMGVVDAASICSPSAVPIGGAYFNQHREERALASARKRIEQFHDRFVRMCVEAKVACRPLLEEGVPSDEILTASQRCDVILMGRKTHFLFATQEEPCDTLRKILRYSPRPVVSVPEHLGDGRAIVVAFDGSLQSARALQAFECSGAAGRDPVHIVTVCEDRIKAARLADRAVDFLRSHDIDAQPHLREGTNAAEIILDCVRQTNARLLVMGAYGQPTFREFFLGSVTRTLLDECQAPLFLYH